MEKTKSTTGEFDTGIIQKYWKALNYVRQDFRSFTFYLAFITLLFIAISSLGAYTPYLLREAANRVEVLAGEGQDFYFYAIAYALCWTLESVLQNLKGIFSAGVLARSDAGLTKVILTRIFNYPYGLQKKINPGATAQDIDRAALSFSSITNSIFWTITPIVISYFVSLFIIWNSIGLVFATLFGLCVATLTWISHIVASKTGSIHSSIFLAENNLQGYIVERLGSLLDIRLNCASSRENTVVESLMKNMIGTIWSANLRMGLYLGFQALTIGLVLCIFTIYSVHLDSRKQLTSGDFVMIAGYVGMLTMQLRFMSGALIDLKRNQVALQRGLDYLYFPPVDKNFTQVDGDSSVVKSESRALFYLENLGLAVEGKELTPPVSYAFTEGEFTAISAPSGAGKTTLINTMLGLIPSATGNVKFRGAIVKPEFTSYILEAVAVAPQTPHIFNESLRFNLIYGANHKITDEKLMELLKVFEYPGLLKESAEEILNERLGSHGRSLSGGEKQRISMARALLRNKDALILDEPTASLNKDLAVKVIRFAMTHVRTLIVITHDAEIAGMAQNKFALPEIAIRSA